MRKWFGLLLLIAAADAQTVIKDSLYSAELGRKFAIAVMLPAEYADSAGKEYPVLYALHGQADGNYTAWADMAPLKTYIADGHPMIVAMFNNQFALYRNEAPFFFNEWIPYIDATYRTIATRNGRAVTGFSSGGYGTMHYAVIHPELFSSACPMSAAFETVVGRELFSRIPDSLAAGRVLPPLFIQCGTEDFLLAENREMRDSLTAWGVPFTYEEATGSHSWTYWRDHSDDLAAFAWEHFRLDTIPPGAPDGVAAIEGEHSIGIVWQAPLPAADGGVPVEYAVYRDGAEIARTALTGYTDAGLPAALSFLYRVVAFDAAGNASDSSGGRYYTAADVSGPRVEEVRSNGIYRIEVVFDEWLDAATATDAGNYAVDGGVAVVSARLLPDLKRVELATSTQTEGQTYRLDVAGVADTTAAMHVMTAASRSFICRFGFRDDFESGTVDAWMPAAGWQVVDDAGDKALMLAVPTGSGPLLVDRELATFSFDCQLRVTGVSDYRNGSIVFGYQDADNYYFANISGKTSSKFNGIMRVRGGVEEQIATREAGIMTDTVGYRQVRVTADPATGALAVYVDDIRSPVFEVVDPLYMGGKTGVWSRSKICYFDNVNIVERVREDVFSGMNMPGLQNKFMLGSELCVYPNPLKSNCLIEFNSGFMDVRILDVDNREIRRLILENGVSRWDGCNGSGARVVPGVYYVKAGTEVRRVLLLP